MTSFEHSMPEIEPHAGASFAKVVKHVPTVHMGQGNTPPRIVKQVSKVHMGQGNTPPRIVKHVPKYLIQHRIRHAADEVGRDVCPIEFGQMTWISRCW